MHRVLFIPTSPFLYSLCTYDVTLTRVSRSRCERPGKSARLFFWIGHERARGRAIPSQVNICSYFLSRFYSLLIFVGSERETLERFGKRNIDEIDRTAFDNFFKRNLDEIDRVGWSGFVKRLTNYLATTGHGTNTGGPVLTRRFG